MDPTNPRWQTADQRMKRSATMWKMIAGAAGTAALTTVIVASCLDRDVAARRALDEPAYVETTSAPSPAAGSTTPVTTRDTTGGIAPSGAVNRAADDLTGAGNASTTAITSAPMATPVRRLDFTPVPVPFERANGDSSTSGTAAPIDTNVHSGGPNAGPTRSSINPEANGASDTAALGNASGPNAGHASHANNDPSNRGSNPESPPMTGGDGRFITEAPYWGSSAWTSDPNAGAGPFETERNTPAH
ncbi:MAG: hypothetical protein NVS3B10_26990 [Polyangiales bacterium]